MITIPLRPYYKFRVNVRPIKNAYFIREDDYESFNKVMQNACSQWGGIRSLIIPVKPDITIDPVFEKALKLHEPDVFVSYIERFDVTGHKNHNALQNYVASFWPHRDIRIQHGEMFDNPIHPADTSVHTLGVISDDDIKGKKLIIHKFIGSSSDQLILRALFGSIYPGQERSYAKTLECEDKLIGLPSDSPDYSIDNPDLVANFWAEQFQILPFDSVLNLTSYGIAPYRGNNGFETLHFNVVLTNSIASLCLYWNLRATREATQFQPKAGRRTLLLPETFLGNRAAIGSLIDFIRATFRRPYFLTNLHIKFTVLDPECAEPLRSAISSFEGLQESTATQFYEGWTGGGGDPNLLLEPHEITLSYGIFPPYFAEKGFLGACFEGALPHVPQNTGLQVGDNEILYEPPRGFRNRSTQSTLMDLDCDVWDRYPKDQGVADLIRHSSRFTRYGLSFIFDAPENQDHININLPDEWTTLVAFFETRGYDISLSVAGKYGNALVDLAGGFSNLNLLASRAAYDLLNTLTFRSTKKIVQQILKQSELSKDVIRTLQPLLEENIQPLIDEIDLSPELKRVTKTYLELSGNLKQSEKEILLNIISELSEKHIIKRGFNLRCERCGTPSWYPLQITQDTLTCSGCSYQYTFPVKNDAGQEIQWEYTLNTLVNRLMDQDALPHILALHHLTRGKEFSSAVPGLLLRKLDGKGQDVTDLDFIFISKKEIYVGECKAGTELGSKDFETARLAAKLGIDHFYYCTVKKFSESSHLQIVALRDEFAKKNIEMSVDVLSDVELLGESAN
jgi:hypothetical protein